MNNNFRKKYFQKLGDFFSLSKKISKIMKRAKNIEKKDKISQAFSEKIMLAVTGVNSCVYCSFRHTKTALEQGVNSDEIRDILNGEFGNVPENEQIALLYAQHWAESGGEPSTKSREKMIEYYGLAKTEHIELSAAMVYIGNLISNTVEAYKQKIRPDRGKVNFFFTYLLCSPIAFFIRTSGKKHSNFVENNVKFVKET